MLSIYNKETESNKHTNEQEAEEKGRKVVPKIKPKITCRNSVKSLKDISFTTKHIYKINSKKEYYSVFIETCVCLC